MGWPLGQVEDSFGPERALRIPGLGSEPSPVFVGAEAPAVAGPMFAEGGGAAIVDLVPQLGFAGDLVVDVDHLFLGQPDDVTVMVARYSAVGYPYLCVGAAGGPVTRIDQATGWAATIPIEPDCPTASLLVVNDDPRGDTEAVDVSVRFDNTTPAPVVTPNLDPDFGVGGLSTHAAVEAPLWSLEIGESTGYAYAVSTGYVGVEAGDPPAEYDIVVVDRDGRGVEGAGVHLEHPFPSFLRDFAVDEVDADPRVVTASQDVVGSSGVLLRRFGLDGTPDESFGTSGGVASIHPDEILGAPASSLDLAELTVTPSGDLLLTGTVIGVGGDQTHPFVAEIQGRGPDAGALDPSFADGGVRLLPTPVGAWAVDSVITAYGTRIVTVVDGPETETLVATRLVDGSADDGFGPGADGTVTTPALWGIASLHQAPGRLLLAGRLELVAFTTDGTPVSTFGDDGILGLAASGVPVGGGLLPLVALDAQGGIYIESGGVLTHLDSDGTTDQLWGFGGFATEVLDSHALAVAPNPSGAPALVAAGSWDDGVEPIAALARFRACPSSHPDC